MNIQPRLSQAGPPTTPDEFLLWNERREGKREFVDGRVVELMINVTRRHVDIATNLILAVAPQLDRSRFSVGSAEFAVRTASGIRYPDFYVDRRSPRSRQDDLVASDPVLVAEILSPSSYGRDFVEKVRDYATLEGLADYVILSQDEPRVWQWSRGRDGAWPHGPQEAAGFDAALDLTGLALRITLASVYAGLDPLRSS